MNRLFRLLSAFPSDFGEFVSGLALLGWALAGLWPTPDYGLITHYGPRAVWMMVCALLGAAQVWAVDRSHYPLRKPLALLAALVMGFICFVLLVNRAGVTAIVLLPPLVGANITAYLQTRAILAGTSDLARASAARPGAGAVRHASDQPGGAP